MQCVGPLGGGAFAKSPDYHPTACRERHSTSAVKHIWGGPGLVLHLRPATHTTPCTAMRAISLGTWQQSAASLHLQEGPTHSPWVHSADLVRKLPHQTRAGRYAMCQAGHRPCSGESPEFTLQESLVCSQLQVVSTRNSASAGSGGCPFCRCRFIPYLSAGIALPLAVPWPGTYCPPAARALGVCLCSGRLQYQIAGLPCSRATESQSAEPAVALESHARLRCWSCPGRPVLTWPFAARGLHVRLWLQWVQHLTRYVPNQRLCVTTFCSQATSRQPLLEPTLALERKSWCHCPSRDQASTAWQHAPLCIHQVQCCRPQLGTCAGTALSASLL